MKGSGETPVGEAMETFGVFGILFWGIGKKQQKIKIMEYPRPLVGILKTNKPQPTASSE